MKYFVVLQVYTCGECGKKIQGTVSIVQHLLAHDSDTQKSGAAKPMTMVNGNEQREGEQVLLNGESKEENDGGENSAILSNSWTSANGLQNGCEEERRQDDDSSHSKMTSDSMSEPKFVKDFPVLASHNNTTLDLIHLLQNGYKESDVTDSGGMLESTSWNGSPQEPMQVEINPLDLLTTVIEEDQKSDNPILPAEHFLLSLPTPTHFLEGDGEAHQEDSTDGFQDNVENGEEVENDGLGDVPSDILLNHPGMFECDKCEETFKFQHFLVTHKQQVSNLVNNQNSVGGVVENLVRSVWYI